MSADENGRLAEWVIANALERIADVAERFMDLIEEELINRGDGEDEETRG